MTNLGAASPAARRKFAKVIVGISAVVSVALGAVAPAQAAGSFGGAEKLPRLDSMLLASSLRRRATSDNSKVEYDSFATSHPS